MTALLRAAALGLGTLLLTACFPTSEHPILAPDGAGAGDPALAAHWRTVDENDDVTLDFLRNADGSFAVVMIERREAERGDLWSMYAGHTAQIAGTRYLSLKPVAPEEAVREIPGYLLFRYETAGGRLTAYGAETDVLAGLVRAGRLEGTVKTREGTDEPTSVHLTSAPGALVEILSQEDPARLFPDEAFTLQRQP